MNNRSPLDFKSKSRDFLRQIELARIFEISDASIRNFETQTGWLSSVREGKRKAYRPVDVFDIGVFCYVNRFCPKQLNRDAARTGHDLKFLKIAGIRPSNAKFLAVDRSTIKPVDFIDSSQYRYGIEDLENLKSPLVIGDHFEEDHLIATSPADTEVYPLEGWIVHSWILPRNSIWDFILERGNRLGFNLSAFPDLSKLCPPIKPLPGAKWEDNHPVIHWPVQ